MKTRKNFVLIDDDPCVLFLNRLMLESKIQGCSIMDFEDPNKGLQYVLETKYEEPTILLLDINMPGLTGWEFLVALNEAKGGAIENLEIIIHSSSIAPEDHDKAEENPMVSSFMVKPLDEASISSFTKGDPVSLQATLKEQE